MASFCFGVMLTSVRMLRLSAPYWPHMTQMPGHFLSEKPARLSRRFE